MSQKVKTIYAAAALVIVFFGAVLCYFAIWGDLSPENSTYVPPLIAEYRKITADEAKKMLDEAGGAILLDVRTIEEYSEQHIPGAMLIADYEISSRAEAQLPDKHALILVYCRSGRRSANAANELVSMGYTNVFDFGGIIDWPYETE